VRRRRRGKPALARNAGHLDGFFRRRLRHQISKQQAVPWQTDLQPTNTLVQDIRAAPYGEEVTRTLDDVEPSLEIFTEICPHCGNVNIFPGFTEMIAYTCQEWGRAVEMGNS